MNLQGLRYIKNHDGDKLLWWAYTPKSWHCLVELNIFSSNHVHHKLIFLKVWNKISITDRSGNILPLPPDFHRVNSSNLVGTVPTTPICSGGPNWRSTFSSLAKNLGEGLNNLFGTNYTYILTSFIAHKKDQVLFGVAFQLLQTVKKIVQTKLD